MIKVGGALLAITAGPTHLPKTLVRSQSAPIWLTFNFHTTITCLLNALLFVDNVITLIMNYVHTHYFAVTKLGIIKLLSMYYSNILMSDVIAYSSGGMQIMCQIDSQYMLTSNFSCFCVLVAMIRVFTASTPEKAPVPLSCDRFARSSCFLWLRECFLQTHFSSRLSTFRRHAEIVNRPLLLGLPVGYPDGCATEGVHHHV